jgi:hypothetical protein
MVYLVLKSDLSPFQRNLVPKGSASTSSREYTRTGTPAIFNKVFESLSISSNAACLACYRVFWIICSLSWAVFSLMVKKVLNTN